jgi:ATP-dependent RNA helicase RhlE
MLDMGFIHDIRRLLAKLPTDRQTLFFSATMPAEITALANQMLRNPVHVAVTPQATTVERITQRLIHVDRGGKPALLAQVLRQQGVERTLVFTRTKRGADKVVRGLAQAGLPAAAIHGNKSQSQRERVLAAFRTGEVRTLVATDIAARGIDVDGITHVINYDLPNVPESYVHRIGRTARAGAAGAAISFCDPEERAYLRDIEKLIRMAIPATDQLRGGHAAPPRPAAPHKAQPPRRTAHGGRSQPQPKPGAPQRHRASRPGQAGDKPARPQHPRQPVQAPANTRRSHETSRQEAPQAIAQGIAGIAFMRPTRRRPAAAVRPDPR